MPVFPMFRRLRQEDYHLFEPNLDCVVRPCLQSKRRRWWFEVHLHFPKATVHDLRDSITQRFEGDTSIAWGILFCGTPVYLLTKCAYSLCIWNKFLSVIWKQLSLKKIKQTSLSVSASTQKKNPNIYFCNTLREMEGLHFAPCPIGHTRLSVERESWTNTQSSACTVWFSASLFSQSQSAWLPWRTNQLRCCTRRSCLPVRGIEGLLTAGQTAGR